MSHHSLKGLDNLVLPSNTDCYLACSDLKGYMYTRILYYDNADVNLQELKQKSHCAQHYSHLLNHKNALLYKVKVSILFY